MNYFYKNASYSYYYIYEVTNLINGKKYIGQHRTDDINDGYLGSGTLLKKARLEFGDENFKLEIIEFCKDIAELYEREDYYITDEIAESNDYYNLIKPSNGAGRSTILIINECYYRGLKDTAAAFRMSLSTLNERLDDPAFPEWLRHEDAMNGPEASYYKSIIDPLNPNKGGIWASKTI